jgi:hypothetical protein
MNRQKLLLSVLLLVLALSVVYSFWKMPRQKTATTLTYRPGIAAKAKKALQPAFSNETKVRLDLLNHEAERFSGFRRNIFGPLVQEKREKIPKRRARLAKPSPLPPPAPMPEPPPMQRDMAQFTFMGFLKKDNRKTIFLSSNNEISLVKKGDMIAGKYLVANITDEMLSIRSSENGMEIIIPLIENRPLNVPGQ